MKYTLQPRMAVRYGTQEWYGTLEF